jgi:hypothetical protein
MTLAGGEPASIIKGRACGECSLCCKVMRVDEIAKHPGTWCKDCAPGKGGCKIYATRPTACRDFLCSWLIQAELGPEWFPASAKLTLQAVPTRLSVWVDPAFPGRWREEPYYSQIRTWARLAVEQQVLIFTGKKVIAVLPNKEVDLGEVEADDHIMVGELNVPPGHLPDWDAYVVKAANIPPEDRDRWIIKGPH